MPAVFILLVVVMMALANTSTMVSEPYTGVPDPSPNYPLYTELSNDHGLPQSGWIYNTGAGFYVAVDFTRPAGNWYLTSIKYAIHLTWPTTTLDGYGVCAWEMSGGVPGSMIWPLDGVPIYNPNSSGTPGVPAPNYKWIIQDVDNYALPAGFLVGITFLYNYPNSDAIALDNSGASAHDWSLIPSGWMAAPYGRQLIRAIIWHDDAEAIEATSIGRIRTLYR